MYTLNDIEQIHFEPSNNCNAECPLCTRTNNKIVASNISEHTLDFIREKIPKSLLQQVKLIKWCGNTGEPPLCKDFIDIQKYIQTINPHVKFVVHTNGGIKSPAWWRELGEVYKTNPANVVNFHIDGLSDTNHVYRVNVVFDRVVENARAFISTGAAAHWVFIPFNHNEHQIDEARKMSEELGFKRFDVKVSARQKKNEVTVYRNRRGEIQEVAPSSLSNLLQSSKDSITCTAQKRKEIYIDCWGYVTPCCWMGTFEARPSAEVPRLLTQSNMIPDDINLHNTTLEKIIASPFFQNTIPQAWSSNSPKVCWEHCRGDKTHMWIIDGEVVPQR